MLQVFGAFLLQRRQRYGAMCVVVHAVDGNGRLSEDVHPPVVHSTKESATEDVSKSSGNNACAHNRRQLTCVFQFLGQARSGCTDVPFQIYKRTVTSGVFNQIPIGMMNMFATT